MEHDSRPAMADPVDLDHGWSALPATLPVPGAGVLPVNSFLLEGPEPVLVDTGLAALEGDFMRTLQQRIRPRDLRWIWLSHVDGDHTGNLRAVLDAAPDAVVVTSFLGLGKLGLQGLPTDRVHLVEEGGRLALPDRELVAMRPPYYDAPETLGFLDATSGTLFAADAFGALLPAPYRSLADVPPEQLREGLLAWSAIDAPWLADLPTVALARRFARVARLSTRRILSSHLPTIEGNGRQLAAWLMDAPSQREAA